MYNEEAHVDSYFEVLSKCDNRRIVPHLAETIALLGPICAEPTHGKNAVVEVLSGFLETIDSLQVDLTFAADRNVAAFFSFTCNGITVQGNEHLHLSDNGLIDRIKVA